MFVLYADKTQLAVREKEPVTSGSVNVYQVQFTFSDDWDGLTRTAVFQAGSVSRSILLDESGTCTVPWEVLKTPGISLSAGVYGEKNGDVVLPTIWARLGLIMEGAAPGEDAQPPTPDLWEQKLAKKGDGLEYDGLNLSLMSGNKTLSTVQVTGGGGGGVVPNIQATAETLPAGSEATVARTGSDANPVFHFGIPRGDQGKEGDPGKPGEPGENGATFTPSVSAEGVISWSNDGGLPNPDPQNIKGSPGNKGDAGPGVPPGGSPGQVLVKKTAADYDAQWSDPAGGFDIYSLEERVVGRWIDGRPLYRRVLEITTPSSATSTLVAELDETIQVKSIQGMVDGSDNFTYMYAANSCLGDKDWIRTSYTHDQTRCGIVMNISVLSSQNRPATLIILYTKTTDQATIELPAALTTANTQTLYKAAPQSAAAVTLDAGIKTEEV